MGYVLKAHTSIGSADSSDITTVSIDTTGADLIVTAQAWLGTGTPPSMSDNKGNTPYSGLTAQQTATQNNIRIFYFRSPVVGTGHTFTAGAASGLFPSIAVLAFNGSGASPFDVENGGATGSTTSAQPGSIFPGQDNELIISAIALEAAFTSLAIDSGFSLVEQQNNTANNEGIGLAYLIQNAKAAVNPTWSWVNSFSVPVAIASFKPTKRLLLGAHTGR